MPVTYVTCKLVVMTSNLGGQDPDHTYIDGSDRHKNYFPTPGTPFAPTPTLATYQAAYTIFQQKGTTARCCSVIRSDYALDT